MPLPINIENLLSGRTVESERIEYKEGWNPAAIYRSICAFANDFSNIGGGYVIIGVKAKDGIPERPVKGIPENQLDSIQQQNRLTNIAILRSYCLAGSFPLFRFRP